MTAAVDDDMLHAITICGTTSDAKAAFAARGDGLARDVAFIAPPAFLVSDRRRQFYARSSFALLTP